MDSLWTDLHRPRRRRPRALAAIATGLTLAAAAAAAVWFTTPLPTSAVSEPSVVTAPPPPAPSSQAPALQPAAEAAEHTSAPPTGPVRPEPRRLVALAPRPAHDWPAPPFVELRRGTAKSTGSLRSVQLVLGDRGTRRSVGDTVDLTVVASAASELAVCVSGPERGIVWRGGVPAGRTALTRDDQQVWFAFAAPGTYRFAVATQLDTCSDTVHVVEVEVSG